MLRNLVRFLLIAVFSANILAQAKSQTSLAPKGFVSDFAEVLDARTRLNLEEKLLKLSADQDFEIAVVTVKTTGNISVSDYSLSLINSWKVGNKTKPAYDLLFLAAIDDRKYYTQVSRDSKSIFSSEWLDKTQKSRLMPEFQSGNYSAGILKTIDAYMERFSGIKKARRDELDRKFRIYEPAMLTASSLQAIVVTSADWTTAKGTAQLFERPNKDLNWTPKGAGFSVVLGKKGLAWSDDVAYLLDETPVAIKREGDGKSPAGVFDLTEAFGSQEKPVFVKLPFTKLEESTECVDDSESASYNRIVDRFKIGNFDWESSEKMLAVGAEYDLGVFVAHNSQPVKRGNGSCIFLHIWKDENSGTAGCTAMARENIESLLAWLEPERKPVLIQMPVEEYQKLKLTWKLPKLK